VSGNDFTEPHGVIKEIRASRDATVVALKFAGVEGWHRVFVREGEVIVRPADDQSPFEWPMVGTTDPTLIRALPGSALPGATVDVPESFTFTPTKEPQLVFFEGGGMSHLDHGDEGPQPHMSDRSLYVLEALLRLASRRVSAEIKKREEAAG
jgi:hypothetical protein